MLALELMLGLGLIQVPPSRNILNCEHDIQKINLRSMFSIKIYRTISTVSI